jgi:hypothetical protein
MNDAQQPNDEGLSHHPAPKRDAVRPHESFFALFGGPIAWFVQLNAGFALASQPCFIEGTRALNLPGGWTRSAMLILIAAACVIALVAMLVSWRAYKRTENETAGDRRHVMDVGAGRTRFLALWGVYLSAGTALVTISTAIAFMVLPPCAG